MTKIEQSNENNKTADSMEAKKVLSDAYRKEAAFLNGLNRGNLREISLWTTEKLLNPFGSYKQEDGLRYALLSNLEMRHSPQNETQMRTVVDSAHDALLGVNVRTDLRLFMHPAVKNIWDYITRQTDNLQGEMFIDDETLKAKDYLEFLNIQVAIVDAKISVLQSQPTMPHAITTDQIKLLQSERAIYEQLLVKVINADAIAKRDSLQKELDSTGNSHPTIS